MSDEKEDGQLAIDRLFKGLTRPAMVFGVSFPFLILNVTVSFMSYMLSEDLVVLLLCLISIHAVAYLVCFKEPLFLELFLIKSQKCSVCKNKLHHGANSYDVY